MVTNSLIVIHLLTLIEHIKLINISLHTNLVIEPTYNEYLKCLIHILYFYLFCYHGLIYTQYLLLLFNNKHNLILQLKFY